MSPSFIVSNGTGDFATTFSSDEHICVFLKGVGISSSEDDDRVIMESCLPLERVTMPISSLPLIVLLFLLLLNQRHGGRFASLFLFLRDP